MARRQTSGRPPLTRRPVDGSLMPARRRGWPFWPRLGLDGRISCHCFAVLRASSEHSEETSLNAAKSPRQDSGTMRSEESLCTGMPDSATEEMGMPELPEIESMARQLWSLVSGKVIVRAICGQPKAVKPSPAEFQALAKGPVTGVSRRAKSLILELPTGSAWLHMGLGGQVVYEAETGKDHPALVAFEFADGSRLAIVHCFMGHARFLRPEQSVEEWQRFGLEPLHSKFTPEALGAIMSMTPRMTVKALLMDQSKIAGIGNTYSDEILHEAGIHPATRVSALCESDRCRLFDATQSVLTRAIAAGGEPEWIGFDGCGGRYVMQIHRREDCGRCGAASSKITLQGRTSYFCPSCQPAPSL